MKRYSWIAALLLTLALGVSLVGCGGEPVVALELEGYGLQFDCIENGWGPGIDFLHSKFKFKKGYTIEVRGTALSATQIFLNNNNSDNAPVFDDKEKKWDPQLKAAEKFDVTLVLRDADFPLTSPKYGAPEGYRLRFMNGGVQSVIFEQVIISNAKGKELFNLSDVLEELFLAGEVIDNAEVTGQDSDFDTKFKPFGLKAAGNDGSIKFTVIGPAE